jgi:hypothetical protein
MRSKVSNLLARRGGRTIKKLVTILLIAGAIAYMAFLSVSMPPRSNAGKRTLAYEQTLSDTARAVVGEPAEEADQSWQATVQEAEPAAPDESTVTASLDPAQAGAETATATDQEQPAVGAGDVATGEQQPDEGTATEPGTEDEQIGLPAEQEANETQMSEVDATGALPDEPQEEWVQIAISGASMYSAAADDATVLFAFPSGRRLKVVSRQEGWLEVTDPQSNTTGWMKAAYLTPDQSEYAQEAQPYEYRERQGGWFRRQREGMSGMINRALGGW